MVELDAEVDIGLKIDSGVSALEKKLSEIRDLLFKVPYRTRLGNSATLDGTGFAIIPIFQCPLGYDIEFQNLLIENTTDGYSYSKTVPVGGGASTGAVTTFALYKNGRLYRPMTPTLTFLGANQEQWYLMPYPAQWSTGQGPYLDEGDILTLGIGPLASLANKNFTVTAEGWMRKIDQASNRLMSRDYYS